MTYQGTTATRWQPWTYRDQSWLGAGFDLTDYKIAAIDGEIGKVDDATYDIGGSYLVVDTGPWIFGRKVMLPAGIVSGIDHQNRLVMVDRTKDQIRNSPEFDDAMLDDVSYRTRLGDYYGESGAGWSQPR
jgi:hypothetical protein